MDLGRGQCAYFGLNTCHYSSQEALIVKKALKTWATHLLGISLIPALVACGGEQSTTAVAPKDSIESSAVALNAGTASTFDVATWNIEWFGSNLGPSNDSLQLQNVRSIMLGANIDVWGLQEIVSTSQFQSLLSQMPGYSGVLANNSIVTNGSRYYDSSEQKVGLVWNESVATLMSAKVILGSDEYYFAGRPPVEFTLRVSLGNTTEDIRVIVMHAKAGADSGAYSRRQSAASVLKSYLDSTYPTQKVWVIGDFNDDLDESIYGGRASSYQTFLNDTADYGFPSIALSNAGVSSTVTYPDIVDHHMVTNEVYSTYVQGSVQALQPNISNYGNTTSDHYPVIARYNLGSSGVTPTPTPIPTPPPGGNNDCVSFSLTTDNYASETSWTLRRGSQTVESGSGYNNNRTYTDTFCLGDGTYTFTINDSYGDGICCGYGSGSYNLTQGTTVLASGGNFGRTESTTFTIGGGGGSTSGQPVTLLQESSSVSRGRWRNYTVTVPAGSSKLTIDMTGSGDADLYIKRKRASRDYPTTSDYEYGSFGYSSNETVTVSNATNPRLEAGEYWISIYGYRSSSFQVTAEVE